jgi:large subunit ribosomal protein L9
MGNQLLLLEDVDDLGRSGDLVKVKPGYARNFLLPQKKAVVADNYTLRLQARLKEERAKLAAVELAEANEIASKIDGLVLTTEVKVDPDGHMYGSVTNVDIARLLENEGHKVDKRSVVLLQAIKQLGVYPIQLKLKEGVPAKITVRVMSAAQIKAEMEQPPAEQPQS